MDIYMDCRFGVSGGAALAALCHLGLDVAALQEMLCAAGVPCRLRLREDCRAAGPGCCVEAQCDNSAVQNILGTGTGMRDVLHNVAVSEGVRHKALAVLDTLVKAEAHATSCAPEDARFQAVQALSMLVEVVGVCWGVDALGIRRVMASPLPWATTMGVSVQGGEQGRGECGQATQPLPRAATARLMEGKPIFMSEQTGEVVTALGAALVHVLAEDFQPGAQGRLQRVGVGYDDRASASLRVLLMEEDACATASSVAAEGAVRREIVSMLESHVDHLSGEELGVALQELSALPEVLDVLWLPGIGKKNRPAGTLRVLCQPRHVTVVEQAFFAHTHSLGVRCQHMERAIVPRGVCTVETVAGPLRAKRYTVDGANYVRVECDALRAAAKEQGLPPLAVARGELRRG